MVFSPSFPSSGPERLLRWTLWSLTDFCSVICFVDICLLYSSPLTTLLLALKPIPRVLPQGMSGQHRLSQLIRLRDLGGSLREVGVSSNWREGAEHTGRFTCNGFP